MKNAIVLTLLALLVPAYAAAGAGSAAPPELTLTAEPTSSRAPLEPPAGEPAAAGDPTVCNEMFTLCTTECKEDFSGSALGACLRLCRLEQKECLAGH